MASSGPTPERKRLKLSRKVIKNNEDDPTGPNEHKIGSTNTQLGTPKNNFIKACLKVSYEAYSDFKKRFQLLYIPGCMNNVCNHDDKNINIKGMSESAEMLFKTEIKNNTWHEALEICLMSITPKQYLSANVLKDIVEIMMNAHEDLDTGFTIDYILRKCQHTLMINFNMHPPCVTKDIRECYKKFLTSPMDVKEFSNRKVYQSDEGIITHCFSRLRHEITMESNDGTLIEEEEIPIDIEGVKGLHWRKENLELFELLVRTERIERCMFVLEIVIQLLQTDIALWHARRISTNSQMRSQRPLVMYLLWPYKLFTIGTVSSQCYRIMELFAYFIHLQYPERHIKTMGLWVNVVVQMFYMYDTHSGVDYPNTSSYCAALAKEFYNIISAFPSTSIVRILKKIQPSFMQYLLGIRHAQIILNLTQNDILCIMIQCVNDMLWSKYPVGDQDLTFFKKSRLKPHKLLENLCKKCKSFKVTNNVFTNTYPKFELPKNDDILQNYLIDILFTTFIAYLETYSIKDVRETLEYYNENENNCDPTSYKSYSISNGFVKQYRSIVKSLQELLLILKDKQDDEPSKKLSELIEVYFS